MYRIIHSESKVALKEFDDNHFDSCITDPPYGIKLIGKSWDYDVPKKDLWEEVFRVMKPGSYLLAFSAPRTYHRAAIEIEDAGFTIVDQMMWMITTKMPAANKMKQCHEPIVVAQKPYEGSLKDNMVKWGVGHVNTTDTRVPWDGEPPKGWVANGHKRRHFGEDKPTKGSSIIDGTIDANPKGRHPSNVVGIFDNATHQKYFYAPRVTKKDRGEGNNHPSPKPADLMRYLIQLVTPVGGKVLDPFNGSGSTGLGALQNKCTYTGIEMDKEYCEISERRLQEELKAINQPENDLFG